MDIDNTGVIDIRIVRLWLEQRDGFYHPGCSTSLLTGFDDDGVYLFCLECNDKAYIGLLTYQQMLGELNV